MLTSWRRVTTTVIIVQLLIIPIFLFHLGGNAWSFAQLFGALFGGGLTLISILTSSRYAPSAEFWRKREQLSWIMIGAGQIMWAIGESFWRYYVLTGQKPFPSLADIGYAAFPLLAFIGLISLPLYGSRQKRLLIVLDSLIAMGALLAISWYLLLGSVAQAPGGEGLPPFLAWLAKFLGLYYPTADTALVSCVVFLFLRGQDKHSQARARVVSFLVLGLGLGLFAASDFMFNLQQNAGTYVEGTWIDLGWSLGMITIGLAAYLRRFLPGEAQASADYRPRMQMPAVGFGPAQLIPYVLIAILFVMLTLNGLSVDPNQLAIRPVLLLATVSVVGLVIVRQILTIRDNERLTRLQTRSLQQIEEQARQIAERNAELEEGIAHLKAVQTSLANGNMRARAQLRGGVLWSLASSLNLLAERLASLGQAKIHAERVRLALLDISAAIEEYRRNHKFVYPASCDSLPELTPLMHAIGLPRGTSYSRAPFPSPKGNSSPFSADSPGPFRASNSPPPRWGDDPKANR